VVLLRIATPLVKPRQADLGPEQNQVPLGAKKAAALDLWGERRGLAAIVPAGWCVAWAQGRLMPVARGRRRRLDWFDALHQQQ
jgi:hypothetical protein